MCAASVFCPGTTLSAPKPVHQPRNFLEPVLLGFYRGMISHQLYLQPFSFLKRRGSGAALLSPRKQQGFQGLCARNWGQRQMYIFFHYFINTLPWNIQNLSKRHVAHRYLFKKYLFWLCGVLVVACEFF